MRKTAVFAHLPVRRSLSPNAMILFSVNGDIEYGSLARQNGIEEAALRIDINIDKVLPQLDLVNKMV